MAEQRATRREVGLAVALVPVALSIALLVLAPGFVEPLFDPAVAIAGMPAGLVMLGLASLLAGVGLLVVVRARGTGTIVLGDVVAMLALAIVILGPAVVVVIKNLGSV
jgi:hypothetical protein